MQQRAWSAKRKRQFAHIRQSLLERGKPEPVSEEIAARVVNKQRAEHDELLSRVSPDAALTP